MAVISSSFAEQNTNQTTSSASFGDVTGATLASSAFTAGKKYLILVTAQYSATNGDGTEVRVVHGSTLFTGSQCWCVFGASADRIPYTYMTVWTAVSSEGIALQYRSRLGGANVAGCNFASVLSICLSDDLTENTDWFFNENTTASGLTSTHTSFASVSLTPAVASQDWLVIGHALLDFNAQITTFVGCRLYDGTNTFPATMLDAQNSALDELVFGLARVYTLPASATTLDVQAATSSGTNGNHKSSRIFALNLHKFREHANAYTEAAQALSETNYATELQTMTLTPPVVSDTIILSYWGWDKKTGDPVCRYRVQLDNSDQPAGQTTAAYALKGGLSSPVEWELLLTKVVDLSAASHTIDLDASTSSAAGGAEGQERTLAAFTLELAAVATGTTRRVIPGNRRDGSDDWLQEAS